MPVPKASKALARFTVLDLTRVRAGPTCVRQLADWGANVIKIELPPDPAGGEPLGGPRDGPDFYNLHRNKRSMTLNVKAPEGLAAFKRMVKKADVVVENFRPDVKKRLKIDYRDLARINPKLVYASISGFGQTGPWAQRPGFDLIAQAMSGVLSSNGFPGMEPAKNSIAVADLGAGLFSVYGILSAIIGREKTGKGQYVDASLLEAALGLSIWETTELWGTGKSPQPIGSANRMSAPYQAVQASDGWFVIGAANQGLWLTFLKVLGREELQEDERYNSNALRVANRLSLIADLAPTFL
ncbi:MAG: CaiB/BaiF CoA transferase family protein, partial [Xanthobacteraceae bacterium]